MQRDLNKLYQTRADHFLKLLGKSEKKSRNIAILRLVVFVLAFLLVYYFAREENAVGIVMSIIISAACFIFLIRIHARAIDVKKMQKAFLKVNNDELNACTGKIEQFGDGVVFNSPEHFFVNDLDIFGSGSLFQFLNRTASVTGYQHLAKTLSFPYQDVKIIQQKQEAVQELSDLFEWRQKFQAIGVAHGEEGNEREKIEEWTESKPIFNGWIFKTIITLVPLLTFFMIVMLSLGEVSVQIFLVYLVIPWGIAGSFAMKVNNRHVHVSKTSEMLNKYARLLHEIEQLDGSSQELQEQKKKIYHDDTPASKSIKALSAILTALDNRLNFVSWALLNGLFVWDILQMVRLEAWQKKYKKDVKKWFEVVGEMDVISCFGNFLFNDTHAIFPEIEEGDFEIYAKEAGHPLIPEKSRVDNGIALKEGGFIIITGANMAGKSTYLRTIGVNLILAMSGAPVCASEFRFSPIQIFTSIRTVDSLKENESYFYAELKRLKSIIEELRKGHKLFIILDEILKGTNSKDKHAGSEALLKQLISLNTSGIVATHDVLLGKLSESFPENIRNHCFEVDIEGNKLNFDYKLRDGVSKNLNATILMREMGITI